MTSPSPLADFRSRPTLILLVCLLLPLIGLGYSWATTYRAAQRGTVWEVPIDGYDPRDLLRGHYVQYRYRWPGTGSNEFISYDTTGLCLNGNAPVIKSVSSTDEDIANCPHGHRVSAAGRTGVTNLDRGRIYVPQTRGAEYESKLGDPKLSALIEVRVDDNGALRPVKLIFRPRDPKDIPREETDPIDRLLGR